MQGCGVGSRFYRLPTPAWKCLPTPTPQKNFFPTPTPQIFFPESDSRLLNFFLPTPDSSIFFSYDSRLITFFLPTPTPDSSKYAQALDSDSTALITCIIF